MRKLRLMAVLLTLTLLTSVAQAQDFIVLSDGSSIPANVLEITQTEVKYKKASNPDGPTYTLAVQGIDYIKFENGTTENFGKQQPQKAPNSDADISNPYASGIMQQPQRGQSDSELLHLSLAKDYDMYMNRASKYKKIAWIGLGSFIVAGTVLGFLLNKNPDVTTDECLYTWIGGAAAGAIWCTSFLIASHNQKKKAEEARYMFGSLMQVPVFEANGKHLSASVDMFRDRLSDNTSIGVGLKFTF